MKRFRRNLKKTGAQLGQIAKEVGEDCNNEVLSNARDFYTGAFNRAKKGMKAAIQAAEEYSRTKEEAARLYPQDIDGYIQYKSPLIQALYRQCGLE